MTAGLNKRLEKAVNKRRKRDKKRKYRELGFTRESDYDLWRQLELLRKLELSKTASTTKFLGYKEPDLPDDDVARKVIKYISKPGV